MLVWLLTGALCIGASIYGIYAANEQSERKKAQGKALPDSAGEEPAASPSSPPNLSVRELIERQAREVTPRKPAQKDGALAPQASHGRHAEGNERLEDAFRCWREGFLAAQQMGAHTRAGERNGRKRPPQGVRVHPDGHVVIEGFPEKLRISRSPSKSAIYQLVSESVREPSTRRTSGRTRVTPKKGVRAGQALAKPRA